VKSEFEQRVQPVTLRGGEELAGFVGGEGFEAPRPWGSVADVAGDVARNLLFADGVLQGGGSFESKGCLVLFDAASPLRELSDVDYLEFVWPEGVGVVRAAEISAGGLRGPVVGFSWVKSSDPWDRRLGCSELWLFRGREWTEVG
jgi:hypothetical protein